MLRTRLWMGTVLVALVVGVLVFDQRFAPMFPCLFLLVMALAQVACWELRMLLPAERRPAAWVCHLAIFCVLAGNWIPHISAISVRVPTEPWVWVAGAFAGAVILAFLVEMANFREAGQSVTRIALAIWLVAYLGVMPCFLAQLRWLGAANAGRVAPFGAIAVALAVFVAKSCDIGAYTAGRLFGKHRMAPILSPKKTWEGAAGGVTLAVIVAIGINRIDPVLSPLWIEIGFGLTVGVAGMLGDLAESLIKRDCQHKDASQAVPGFGGVLDVVDAILFAAPVAFGWLYWM